MATGHDTTALTLARRICTGCESALRLPGRPMACGAREDRAPISDHPVTVKGFCPKGKHDDIKVSLTINASDLRAGGAGSAVAGPPTGLRKYAHGLAGIAKAAFKIDPTPPETEAERLAKCGGCDARKSSVFGDRCSDCGCIIKLKVKVAGEHCPRGHWGPAAGAAPQSHNCGGGG